MTLVMFQSVLGDGSGETAVVVPIDIDRGGMHALRIYIEVLDKQGCDIRQFCAAAGPAAEGAVTYDQNLIDDTLIQGGDDIGDGGIFVHSPIGRIVKGKDGVPFPVASVINGHCPP